MIRVGNIVVSGFDAAMRGMRNPMESWDRSDTYYGAVSVGDGLPGHVEIGRNDLELARKLFAGGTEHRKFLRMIHVSMDITAPDFWFKEFSTYKIGVTENSTSTMHKLTSRPITADDFSMEHCPADWVAEIVQNCECLREEFVEEKDLDVWRALIEILPMSYNYRRTVDMNYENVFNMIHQRENHKLSEWRKFVEILKELPYVKEIGGLQ